MQDAGELSGEEENPFEKGLFSFPRPPILFPKTFIGTTGSRMARSLNDNVRQFCRGIFEQASFGH